MDGNDHNRSSYSVHCTEGKVSGAAKKSRHFSNGIIALIMTVSILCGMGSGVGSYFLADYLHRPSPEEAIPVFNTNPPTLTPNEGGPQLQSEETTPPPTTNAPTNAPEVNPATLAPQESVTPATLPPEESALPEQSANPGISPPTQSAPPRFDTPIDDVSEHVTLNMNVFYNGTTAMEYMQIDGSGRPTAEYVALNGKTYLPGDLKPIWAELQKRLNFTIRDVRPLDANHFSEGFKVAEAMDFDYNDILMGMSEQIVNGGLEMNAFIDFGMYLDLMPNFKAFLQNNDVARLSLTSGDGGIYCAPYFDGFDDIERMFIFRADWVRRLLDEDAAFDTDREVDTYYKPYIDAPYDFTVQAVTADGGGVQTIRKKAGENVITTQNNLEVKNGETLTNALRAHIDAVYGDTYKNRSDLFIGQDAAYDADEMVALLRCVLANTSLLTGQSERPAVPFYPRWYQMGRAVDVYRLASIWGVRGLESRTGGYLYLDRNGEMKDARLEMEFMDGVERLNMLYKEGLILQNFDTLDATEGLTGADHRDRLNRANLGFATYDYNQTTTNLNILESKIPGFELTPVLPPVADWDRTGDYYQFTESWRSTNNQGWGVVRSVEADQAKLYRALKLVDYMYSPEGNALMSYGPELWINGEIEYFGRQIPKLSDAAINELNELAGGNYPNYYRMWLGAMFPIGYIKDQGAEYQVTHPAGQKGLDKILRACQLGTMRHLVTGKAKARNPSDLLLPSMFALDYPDEIVLREQVETFNAVWRPGMNDTDRILVTDYVLFGFGGKTYFGETLLDKQGLIDYQTDVLNADVYLSIYSSVYEIMRMAAGMDSL